MSLGDEAATTPSIEFLRAEGWVPIETEGFIGLIGPLLYKPDDATRFGFVAEAKHENRRGVVQGGMIAAFADRTMAMACHRANNDLPQATIELSVRYIDAVHVGEFVQASCEIVRKTRSVIFVRATLKVGSRVVATADGIWKILGSKQAT